MSIPKNRQTFIDHCLRSLGSPVIQINIADEQISDKVDEALRTYQRYHYDAIEHSFFLYKITQKDIDSNYIPITSDVVGIISVMSDSAGNQLTNWMNNLGASMRNMMYDLSFGSGIGGCGSIGNYSMMMTKISDLSMMFNAGLAWSYHQHMNRLIINEGISTKFAVDDYLMLEIYRVIDPQKYPDVWGDMWLMEYGAALIGRQWGTNLSKYANVQLPGGLTLDGDKIFDRYDAEVKRLEEELDTRWGLPVDFMVG
jgi:hypothetical protein